MALPASGAISLSQVNTELGLAATTAISLNQANVRNLAGVASGAISMSNLLGKSAVFVPTSWSTTALNSLFTGWGSSDSVTAPVVYSNGYYQVVGQRGKYARSTDGVTWTAYTTLNTAQSSAAVANSGLCSNGGAQLLAVYAATAYGVAYSDDNGATWSITGTNVTSLGWSNVTLWACGYKGTTWMIFGNLGQVATSTDRKTWTSRTSLSTGTWGANPVYAFATNGTTIVIGGTGGRIATSTDGITWTFRNGLQTTTWGTSRSVTQLIYGNGMFVAVGQSGGFATSPDGITWTWRATGNTVFGTTIVNDVWYQGGAYLATGYYKMAYSTDGATWTAITALSSFTTAWAFAKTNKFFTIADYGQIYQTN